MKKLLSVLFAVFIAISLSSCGNIQADNSSQTDEVKLPQPSADTENDKPAEGQKPIDYSTVKPNELGQVMVLMYHEIGSKEADWVRTPENFRRDLQTLYDKGYRLISLNDLLDGRIDTEAGYTPVVLTFDDGDLGQFKVKIVDDKPTPDPDSAVGILMDFYKQHPDFGNAATFYIYHPLPFREKEYIDYKLNFLAENGFEIGNHTDTHANLPKLDGNGIQKELALNVKHTQDYLPGYEVNTLALPYGSVSQDNTQYLSEGSFEGVEYHNKAVLLVGSNPAKSPYDVEFNPLKVPRVRGSEMNVEGFGIYDWIKYFDEHPEKRYISDGDPDTIVVPEGIESKVNINDFGTKEIVVY